MSIPHLDEIVNFLKTTPANQQWTKIGVKHHHGICIPLFSLRTQKSSGIGEFFDLVPMIEWASKVGLDILQLLPLNDNGEDQSPYSALSAFALNPLHISLYFLPDWSSIAGLKDLFKELQLLNLDPYVRYDAVISKKMKFLKRYYEIKGENLQTSEEFLTFKSKNPWLLPFALFKSLKQKKHWTSFQTWEKNWKHPTRQEFDKLLEENQDEILFHSFLQLICHKQFSEVKNEAVKHEILLKGDIPILISKESADVWDNQSIFNTTLSAGAPPDMYNPNGQDWGFPTYNWDLLEKDHYKWWTERLNSASQYYDLYRLDHIVGFYRIWVMDLVKEGFPRSFMPQDETLWVANGEKILRALTSCCKMLPIGEDLGTVPKEVRANMKSLGICGTKVMRWERKWKEDKSFIPLNQYEPLSMTTVSTHDSETLQLWWRQNQEEAEEFARFKGWNYQSDLKWDHHREILFDSHNTSSLLHINLLQEYLALIPDMTSPNLDDERINIPGTISTKNWSYKFRPSVEEMVNHPELQRLIQEMVTL